jgi:hypothetical protein
VAADGITKHWEFTAEFDGKDNPIIGSYSDADVSVLTRSNANTIQVVNKGWDSHRHSDLGDFARRLEMDGHVEGCERCRTTGDNVVVFGRQ